MKLKIYTLLVISFSTLLFACKSASKLYDKGDYDAAVELAVKKLQKDPYDAELKSVLRDAYRHAVEERESNIRNHSNSSNDLKWGLVYNEYARLQSLHDVIRRSPEAYRYVKPTDYSSHMSTYREKAAEAHYTRAMNWMEKGDKEGDKESYQRAYREFHNALRYKQGDIALTEKLEEAYEGALTNVIVMPLESYGYRYSSYQMENFGTNMLRNLQNQVNNDFIKFLSAWEGRSRNVEPDHIIETNLNRVNLGRMNDEKSTREVSREVVIKETVYKPDSIVKQYGKVYAKITTTRRIVRSDGTLQINIRDNNGRWLWSDNITGEHYWQTEFASYTGDERALSDDDKRLVNRREEAAPREDDVIEAIMRDINSKMTTRIRDYYNRF